MIAKPTYSNLYRKLIVFIFNTINNSKMILRKYSSLLSKTLSKDPPLLYMLLKWLNMPMMT